MQPGNKAPPSTPTVVTPSGDLRRDQFVRGWRFTPTMTLYILPLPHGRHVHITTKSCLNWWQNVAIHGWSFPGIWAGGVVDRKCPHVRLAHFEFPVPTSLSDSIYHHTHGTYSSSSTPPLEHGAGSKHQDNVFGLNMACLAHDENPKCYVSNVYNATSAMFTMLHTYVHTNGKSV